MAHKKVNLPQKTCPICKRPFTWRKKVGEGLGTGLGAGGLLF